MKSALHYRLISVLLLVMVVNMSFAQDVNVDNIERAMKKGNATALADYFGASVDITINNNEYAYSATQAQLVLRDFFKKNVVKDFSIKRLGNQANNDALYAIGMMATDNGAYKVYFYLKQMNKQPYLQKISFVR